MTDETVVEEQGGQPVEAVSQEDEKPRRGRPKGSRNKPKEDEPVELAGQTWRFVFVGDPNDEGSGPDTFEAWDLTFKRDEPTEVPDRWLAERLLANSHFELVE